MYLTASIRPSHMSSPTKLFMKKFLFDGHPIFPYLNLQAKIPQTGTCHFAPFALQDLAEAIFMYAKIWFLCQA